MLKTSLHRLIQLLFILVLLCGNIRSQEYKITIWGFPVGIAKIQQDADNIITLKLKSNEFIDYVFPVDLVYFSKFDKTKFNLIENKKTSKQGTEQQEYEAKLKRKNILVYNDNDSIYIESNTFSLLSLLTKIMNSPTDSIDTKWFNLENEGILYKTRLLWNDTTRVSINDEDILCDHYRLDLKILNDDNNIFEETDYFNELFFDINSIRQIWVEKWQKRKRIIKIVIKNNLIDLRLTINN